MSKQPSREAILKYLDTKPLLTKLNQLEDELEKSLREEAEFKSLNYGFLGNDCAEVKRLEAELAVVAEGSNDTQRKAWLQRQPFQIRQIARTIAECEVSSNHTWVPEFPNLPAVLLVLNRGDRHTHGFCPANSPGKLVKRRTNCNPS